MPLFICTEMFLFCLLLTSYASLGEVEHVTTQDECGVVVYLVGQYYPAAHGASSLAVVVSYFEYFVCYQKSKKRSCNFR